MIIPKWEARIERAQRSLLGVENILHLDFVGGYMVVNKCM